MDLTNLNANEINLDQWALHDELGKEYARQRELRGGKTIHELVAWANAPRMLWGRPRRRRIARGIRR